MGNIIGSLPPIDQGARHIGVGLFQQRPEIYAQLRILIGELINSEYAVALQQGRIIAFIGPLGKAEITAARQHQGREQCRISAA